MDDVSTWLPFQVYERTSPALRVANTHVGRVFLSENRTINTCIFTCTSIKMNSPLSAYLQTACTLIFQVNSK